MFKRGKRRVARADDSNKDQALKMKNRGRTRKRFWKPVSKYNEMKKGRTIGRVALLSSSSFGLASRTN